MIEAVRTVLRSVTEQIPYCKSRSEDLNLTESDLAKKKKNLITGTVARNCDLCCDINPKVIGV